MSKKYFKERAALEAKELRLAAIGAKISVAGDRGHDSEVDEIMEKYEEHQAANNEAASSIPPALKRKRVLTTSSSDDDAPPAGDVRSLAAGAAAALAPPRYKKPR